MSGDTTPQERPPLEESEAEEMLARLSEHYRCPVLPAERFCAAFRQWFDAVREAGRGGDERMARLGRAIDAVDLAIMKSSLLARLIYGGEKLRTKKCPEHRGRWSGIGPCEHGCGSTGWVPDDWPDSAPRCTAHPDRPAVGATTWLVGGEWVSVDMCFACYRERWGA